MTITTERRTIGRVLLASLGVVCIALGVIGIFVPGLPTTEFVLAASFLFARSSPRLQHWLESNRLLGPTLMRFRETRGMPRKAKLLALTSMWIGIGVTSCGPATASPSRTLHRLAVGCGSVTTRR